MAEPEEPDVPILPFTAQRGHVRISVRGEHSEGRNLAERAQQNLCSLTYIGIQARQDLIGSMDPAARQVVPNFLVFGVGFAALALQREALPLARLGPPDLTHATMYMLAASPRIMFLRGGIEHVKQNLEYRASRWIARPDWASRVLCADPPPGSSSMRTPTRFGAKDAAYRAELLTVSHQLACGAAPFHRGVDIVIETDTDSRNTLVPVLDPTGIELAAWAQWAQHLAYFEPEHGSLARDAELIELGAILLATRLHDQAPKSRTMYARNHPSAPSVPTELAVGLFTELLTNDAAICRAAHLAQTDTDTAYQTLIDARREVVGPHLSIVRGDG